MRNQTKVIFIDYNPTEQEHWIYDVAKLPESYPYQIHDVKQPIFARSYTAQDGMSLQNIRGTPTIWGIRGRRRKEGLSSNDGQGGTTRSVGLLGFFPIPVGKGWLVERDLD